MMGWFSRVRHSVRWKISIFITIFFLFIFVLLGILAYLFTLRNISNVFYTKNLSFSKLSGEEIGRIFEDYFEGGFPYFEERIGSLRKMNRDIERIQIFSIDGYILYDSHLGKIRKFCRDERIREMIKRVETVERKVGESFEVVVPILGIWGRHRYSIRFVYSLRSIKKIRKRLTFWICLSIVLGGFAVFFISYLTARTITAPIENLSSSLMKDEVKIDVEEYGEDEIGRFARFLSLTLEKLRNTLRELEEANRAKDSILENVSHELKTPLTAAKGYVEYILTGKMGDADERIKEALVITKRNLQRLEERIHELLRAREEEYRGEYEKRNFSLKLLVREVTEEMKKKAEEKGLYLRYIILDEIPPVYGDREKIREVFENLLDNAIKFTDNGGVEVRVEKEGNMAKVSVKDTGIGMDEEEIKMIFEKFTQASPEVSKRFGGVGLGLPIVKSIVEAHGGRIWVESRKNEGSTFYFTIPLYRGGEDEEKDYGSR